MKTLSARLPIALATFLLGLLITGALTPTKRESSSVSDERPQPKATPFAFSNSTFSPATPTPEKAARISQQEIVNFPGVGRIRISADETFGRNLRLLFENADSGKQLLEEPFYGTGDCFEPDEGYPSFGPYARFKVLHIKGLPDPLIVGLAISPGGSDSYWEAVAVGAAGGELKELTPEHLNAADEGGFFFGDLGGGRGPGATAWDFIWDMDYESHVDPHQYELKVYKWDRERGRFGWYQVLRTRGRFHSDQEAVRSLGFNPRDVRKSFADFKDFWSE